MEYLQYSTLTNLDEADCFLKLFKDPMMLVGDLGLFDAVVTSSPFMTHKESGILAAEWQNRIVTESPISSQETA